ncbi:MAG: MOSC domain-containing protein [Gammaproteobacteria bacterium]|nr:MOSC domain-containing protein [Gammaproteobacteria bacterium]
MPRLIGIAIKPHNEYEMKLCEQASITTEAGVAGDSRGKPGSRQVTVLSLVAWTEACSELGIQLDWIKRRANLLVDDIPLQQSIGQSIIMGDAVLEITGETDPCTRMEKVHKGLFNALAKNWRGGVTCRVLNGGTLVTGMPVSLGKS